MADDKDLEHKASTAAKIAANRDAKAGVMMQKSAAAGQAERMHGDVSNTVTSYGAQLVSSGIDTEMVSAGLLHGAAGFAVHGFQQLHGRVPSIDDVENLTNRFRMMVRGHITRATTGNRAAAAVIHTPPAHMVQGTAKIDAPNAAVTGEGTVEPPPKEAT